MNDDQTCISEINEVLDKTKIWILLENRRISVFAIETV